MQAISLQIAEPPSFRDTDTAQSSSTASLKNALEICDEMSDRERTEYDIVVYNFSECADCKGWYQSI